MDTKVHDLAETLIDCAVLDGDLPKDISKDAKQDLIESLGRDLQQTYEDFMEYSIGLVPDAK